MCIVGVYAPNDNIAEQRIEEFYTGLWTAIENEVNSKKVIICGDFNAKITGY